MKFTDADLTKIARLARLSLNAQERSRLPADMERILQLVAQLQEIDVEGIKPMYHAEDRSLPLRSDQPRNPCGRASLQSSQGYEDGLIRVPKIIE